MRILLRMAPLVALVICGCTEPVATKPPQEYDVLVAPSDAGWKIGSQNSSPGLEVTEWVRQSDDINNWHELITIEDYGGTPKPPKDVYEALKGIVEKKCPGATTSHVLAEDDRTLTYEQHIKPCMGFPEQYEIARIIDGKYSSFRIRRTAKVTDLPPDQQAEWVTWAAAFSVTTKSR